MNGYYQVTFTVADEENKNILIALLASAGYEGFEEADTSLRAFISAAAFDERLIADLAQQRAVSYQISVLAATNWNSMWESNFQPVLVNDFCYVRADFHPPLGAVRHEIIITPKMSFGTGHHATTFMMMEQMAELDFLGKKVFDFGTGTGILAILAEKLGAAGIVAMDNDDWSIENARENLQKNHCAKIQLVKADQPIQDEPVDILLANITKNVILENLAAMSQQVSPGGVLVVSGLLAEDDQEVTACAEILGFRPEKKLQKKAWICLTFSH